MADQSTGDVQKGEEEIVVKPEEVKPIEPKPEGESTPSKKEDVVAPEVKPEVIPEVKPKEEVRHPISVQQRIDRMHARIGKEREKRIAAEERATALERVKKEGEEEGIIGEEEGIVGEERLTRRDVEGIISGREIEKRFHEAETQVLLRHPDALTDDGEFNMDDPFIQRYIRMGRENPQLAFMERGPTLAEAMAEKELEREKKSSQEGDATRSQRAEDAHTLSSTTRPAPASTKKVELTIEEKRVARRMGITDEQYAKQKEKAINVKRM